MKNICCSSYLTFDFVTRLVLVISLSSASGAAPIQSHPDVEHCTVDGVKSPEPWLCHIGSWGASIRDFYVNLGLGASLACIVTGGFENGLYFCVNIAATAIGNALLFHCIASGKEACVVEKKRPPST